MCVLKAISLSKDLYIPLLIGDLRKRNRQLRGQFACRLIGKKQKNLKSKGQKI
jgi:hypothetical protein